MPLAPQALPVLKRLMQDSWKIIEKVLYVRGHVFNRNAQMFDRYFLTYFIMTVQHTRDHWDPNASDKVQPTQKNLEIMIREKDEAVEMARGLQEWLKPEELGVNPEIEKYLHFVVDVYGIYAEIFRQQIITAAYMKRAEASGNAADIAQAEESCAAYEELAARLDGVICGKRYSNNVEYVMDGERVRRFSKDCVQLLAGLKK